MTSIGKGCVTGPSKKPKVNKTRSTISEVVGAHQASSQVLWAKEFLQNKGSEVNKATIYQINISAILLKTNGPASSSSRTKHIDIR